MEREAEKPETGKREAGKRGAWSWWYLLFAVQFVVILWPPLYNRAEPYLWGIPFFYWFQLLWIIRHLTTLNEPCRKVVCVTNSSVQFVVLVMVDRHNNCIIHHRYF